MEACHVRVGGACVAAGACSASEHAMTRLPLTARMTPICIGPKTPANMLCEAQASFGVSALAVSRTRAGGSEVAGGRGARCLATVQRMFDRVPGAVTQLGDVERHMPAKG